MIKIVSIIIPVRNQLQYTKQCIKAIHRYTELPYEVILVDNQSTDKTKMFITAQMKQRGEKVRGIRNELNRGFAAGINQGMREAKGQYIVLLNNDTLPSYRWVEQLIAPLQRDDSVGMTGPVSNRVISEQKIKISLTNPDEIHRFSRLHNRPNSSRWRESKRLSGFCLALPRHVWKSVGEWDERFGLGTYEDDDYSYRIRQKGWRLIVAGDTYVHHFGNRSFHKRGYKEFSKILAQNRRYFLRKWNLMTKPKGLLL
ncbi:Glycosyltransferase, GT2 family [Marininema mesophilum]|uniref:Glycosyltransferase, GT2 family n=1 Tax=Marininema mesophilum TaxID=1048340 RepID=A0A1H2ZJ05_9BACL|nr:glycosyltransferase family 2 protein [Marininema mesophilum]SDX16948.1 Glycosyltransferase, GT2 family [Marininema mesophilum]